MTTKDIWNAKIYTQFLNLRNIPVEDLLRGINKDFVPKIIYDLGCGPGNSTIALKQRFNEADITGMDSSLDMLREARSIYPDINPYMQISIPLDSFQNIVEKQ